MVSTFWLTSFVHNLTFKRTKEKLRWADRFSMSTFKSQWGTWAGKCLKIFWRLPRGIRGVNLIMSLQVDIMSGCVVTLRTFVWFYTRMNYLMDGKSHVLVQVSNFCASVVTEWTFDWSLTWMDFDMTFWNSTLICFVVGTRMWTSLRLLFCMNPQMFNQVWFEFGCVRTLSTFEWSRSWMNLSHV